MTIDTVPDRGKRLFAVVMILLAGILTGAQLGKIAPLIPWYRDTLGFSLVSIGWLASILGVFIAACALPAGWGVARLGLLRSIILGSATLAVGGFILAYVTNPTVIFGARLIEAVGYLALCIALPSALNAISPPSWKGPVLAIWSGFVPVGFAVADLLAGGMAPHFAPQTFLVTLMVLFCIFMTGAVMLLRDLLADSTHVVGQAGSVRGTIALPIVLLAISFGAYVVLTVGLFNFLPVFIAGEGAHFLLPAGAITLAVPIGNILASILVRGKTPSFIAKLTIAGFVIGIIAIVPALHLKGAMLATSLALIAVVAGAVVSSAQFAAVPYLVPEKGSVPVAFGLISQFGGTGTMFGPPIAAAVIEAYGWTAFSWFLAGFGVLGAACMVPLIARRASPRP